MNTIIEAFFICLLASMIWAPVVFLIAQKLTDHSNEAFADKVWPIALVISALPAMFSPFAAAMGLSLRTSAPLPPLTVLDGPINIAPAAPAIVASTASAPLDLTTVFEAAAVLYFYGFLMFLTLGIMRMVWFSYRVHYAFEIDDPQLKSGLEEWRRRIGVQIRPRYAFSDAVSSVCVHGLIRPVILMPMQLLDRVSVHDAILMGAHEMAHIKRGDTRLFALCTAARAVFWFNPFMQRIAACANLAAEQAADALVINSGAERRQYAQCFVQGLRFAAGASNAARDLVPSFTPFDKQSRRERLNAILSNTRKGSILTLKHKISLVLSVIAAAVIAFAQAALAVTPSPAAEALSTAPVRGVVTMSFGELNNVLSEKARKHSGVDIKAKRGTAVHAAGDGKVIDATSFYRGQSAWGKVVVLDHGHGLVTRYAHLDSYQVKKGDTVDAGDVIGEVGSTGRSTGPHLHFEVIQDGLPIDPAPVIAAEPMSAPAPIVSPAATTDPVLLAPEPIAAPASPSELEEAQELLDQKLTGRFGVIETKLANAFDGFEFKFSDITLDVEDFTTFAATELEEIQNLEFLSEEDREAFAEVQRDAAKAARKAMRDAQKKASRLAKDRDRRQRDAERVQRDLERAERERERAERHREREQAHAERARERTERDAERARERAERNLERAIQRAEAQAERELARAEREWSRLTEHGVEIDHAEILALQEEALLEAQADLEKQLQQIKRQRAELRRQKKTNKSN